MVVGATVIDCEVAPVLHPYEVPPLAVNTTALPGQDDADPGLTVAGPYTGIEAVVVALQPLLPVAVTV